MSSNPWITHVKSFAKRNNISYMCAITTPTCKSSYSNSKKENINMSNQDINIKPIPKPRPKPRPREPTQLEKNKIIIDNFDEEYIDIILYQNNQTIHDNLEKKINNLVNKNHNVSLVDLLFYTKVLNKELFKKWDENLILSQLKNIVMSINNDAKPFIGDIKRIYKYK